MEDFGYKKNNESKTNFFDAKKVFLFSATLFSISAFIFISLKAYNFINQDNKEVETIKGPSEPIKIYEESDYNDKNSERVVNRSIYDDIFGNRRDIIREDIKINKNSEPAFPPRDFDKNNQKSEQNSTDFDENSVEAPENSDKNLSEKNNSQPTKEAIKINESSTEIDKKSQPKPIPKKRSSIRVQISAMSSKESCEEYFKKLNRLYPTIFSRTKYYIEQADLGKRGMFYRLQIGDFYNQVDAEEFCAEFISQSQKSRSECIIVE